MRNKIIIQAVVATCCFLAVTGTNLFAAGFEIAEALQEKNDTVLADILAKSSTNLEQSNAVLANIIEKNEKAPAVPLDKKVESVMRDSLQNMSGVNGCGVVDAMTGDIIATYIMNTALLKNSNTFAISLTNIIKSMRVNMQKIGFDIKFSGIRTDNGVYYIGVIDQDTFVGCFYQKTFNAMENRLVLVNNVIPNLKKVLQ